MRALIENLLSEHEEKLNEVFDNWLPLHLKCSEACQGNGTTGSADCKFLQLLCIERKPKKILEIGTWVGNTAYAMSFATKDVGALIHTCDKVSWGNDDISEMDMFLRIDCEEAERININPNTWSSDFLRNEKILNGVDFIFNDANISLEDCQKIYDLADDKFCFITHDYYNEQGGYEKGAETIESMRRVIETRKGKYNLYTPEEEWYTAGYKAGVNGCCALIECEK
jgi:hypothetical protein